ncbi:hypothetical protein BZA05DRAFT_403006 [Tricharina praecox]|uniref:uncharacterized protein n=1 Tax=Tricharina praecox TaxID=43433 RepID=UPI002220DFC7|nr:uncharacterized protein BZA05DRAFT_403006 [Tricharina praecox]KAI5848874.1 hypothetical protein BZA05DRAFT_403006 [Tricharina praecox]
MAQTTPRKRQNLSTNQASITTFFKPAHTGLSGAPLSDTIQSGLLSVGMRIRKSVPEGYKSGTYAFNKHLPSTGILTPPSSQESVSSVSTSTSTGSPRKKRALEADERRKPMPPVSSINAWARSVKVPTGPAGKKKGSSSFYQAVERKDIMLKGEEDFDEAEFLKPVDEMEE